MIRLDTHAARLITPGAAVACLAAWMALGAAPAAAFEPAVEYDWGTIRCLSEVPLPDAQRLRADLLQQRRDVEERLQLRLGAEPIEIRLYSSRRRYLAEVSALSSDVRRQRGLYVIREGRACVFSFPHGDLEQTLRHEATHAWLHSALPYVPLWLDEGLASYFEAVTADEADARFLERLQWSMQLGWRPDVTRLERIRRAQDLDIGDYRHAWGWVHFLLHESDASRAVLTGYLGRIAAGDPPQPLSGYLAEHLPDAGARCTRHLQEWNGPRGALRRP